MCSQPVNQALRQPNTEPYQIRQAATLEDIRQCQQLRYRVFGGELGASLNQPTQQIDEDQFDPYATHIMVIDNATNQLIATTRILTNQTAKQAGSFYSETEFNLEKILDSTQQYMEVGRTCVHRDYRAGTAINLLWQGVAQQIILTKADYIFGCVSIPLNNDGHYVESLLKYLSEKGHFIAENQRVQPIVPLPSSCANDSTTVVLPSLLKRYLTIGAKICGEPCFDADFNVADLFVLVDCKKINPRYQRRFLYG